MAKLLILNFTYPLSTETLEKIRVVTHLEISEERRIATKFSPARDFEEQAEALIQACKLSSEEWQLQPLLIVLPSFNIISALLLVQIHGLSGHFPAILRLKEKENQVPHIFEYAEIIDLQDIREKARNLR